MRKAVQVRKSLSITGRILATIFILAWWTLGLVFLYTGPAALIYIVPLEIVGAVMAWKISDPDRRY